MGMLSSADRKKGSTLCLMEKKKIVKLHRISREDRNDRKEEPHGRDRKARISSSWRGRKK